MSKTQNDFGVHYSEPKLFIRAVQLVSMKRGTSNYASEGVVYEDGVPSFMSRHFFIYLDVNYNTSSARVEMGYMCMVIVTNIRNHSGSIAEQIRKNI